ncbi:protein cordon-bleu isoform X3 [Echeneis naucrates]|uniref:WH2 domain-containing protein n=1 Tax=Echeneis naucrates TaxID=173247 RepID=A0A665UKG5_ECHNA|nr:protein cordon-bleu isoform X3 [Echeneis naucrates]
MSGRASGLKRRMKARAPPPPQVPQPAPRHIFRNAAPDEGGTSGMDAKENMLMPRVALQLTLPTGYKTSVTEDGSKALMDLLVELCSRYHLNPALHTLELLSPEGHSLGFKPNAFLGSLNVACVLIKEKVWEEKAVRRPAPKVPEKTVRLMVNYHGSQKAVVRVNPLVSLRELTPSICEKCEFDPAHVLLLKDAISRHELPLDKSLTELGIKELYVHDCSLVLQPKMASAPALNCSDCIRSSTTTLGIAEKKGLLGIFQFSRKKSKTETTSMDMDDCDDRVIQNTDTQSNPLSTASREVEDRPGTLGQSHSVMNISRLSPKAETKKRRAPAPPEAQTPIMEHTNFEGYQMGHGSESQQRKRKAPAPPPTPSSITASFDDTSTSAAPSPDSPTAETPNPTLYIKVSQSVPVSSNIVQTPAPLKTEIQPATLTASSPTPSSSTNDSLGHQDSSSEFSHSPDDSDADLDQTGSLTSSTVSGSVLVQSATKTSSSRMVESEKSSNKAGKLNPVTSTSSSRSETESALNLKMDEVENNRHSAMGTTDQSAPPKPRHSPAQEPPHLVPPPAPSTPPPNSSPAGLTESDCPVSPMEEAAPQSWLHSMQNSAVGGKPDTETPEEETMSLSSSSSGSSLPDQGYAASEGMVEGEDSGMVSSPSDTQPTSPDGSLSLDGANGGGREKLLRRVQDNSSDSDEGCATWGSRCRSQPKSGRLKDSYEDDPELAAQLHQTSADFETDLADHVDVSVKETPYTLSTDCNKVPVSVVDMDVPVTAIDEVLEEYECIVVENETKSLTRSESAGSKGENFCHQSSINSQNKNNNACTAADSDKNTTVNTKQPPQPEQHRASLKNKPIGDEKKDKITETKINEMSITDTKSMKEDKRRRSAVKPLVNMQKQSKNTEIKSDPVKNNIHTLQEKKPVLAPTSQTSVSTEKAEKVHRVNQNNTSSNYFTYSKITHNVTSRFGMKTFTVVPPKPSVVYSTTENPAVTSAAGAIKIDDQGNMVKERVSQDKVGGSPESGNTCREGSPLITTAKLFWSSNERQESNTPHSKGQINKAKEKTDGLRSTPTVISETALKTNNTEHLKTTPHTVYKSAERAQPNETIKEALAKEAVKDDSASKDELVEVESKISVSKNIQQPSNRPALLPDMKKDLSYLRPSRCTSSQYVASAISKYTPKTAVKPNSVRDATDSSVPLKTQAVGFQRSGRSIQVNPHASSQSALSDNMRDESTFKPNPSGPKRLMSYPGFVSNSQKDFGEVRLDSVGSTKTSSVKAERDISNRKHLQSTSPAQTNVTANNDRDDIQQIWPRGPNTAPSGPLHSSANLTTAPKTVSKGQTSNTKDMTNAATHLTPHVRPEPSVTVSDSDSGPQPVTVFGPVKKFRPVICRSVEKETSLHSSLMEAIQTGGGRERLKKISSFGPSSMKKQTYVEEENERSALLAAIRAQSNTSKLKKTKSEAADELERFRKEATEEERSADAPSSPSPPSVTSILPPVLTSPSPAVPMAAPPPPPPVLPQGKPSTVAQASANIPVNPALAREAMLVAIRSGSAAERLKKVAVPTKTIQVNGRLGTIQPTSSALPQQ